jgi:hypothetical protein
MGGNGGTSAGGSGGSAGADAAAGAGGTSDGGGDVSEAGGATDGGADADAVAMCGTATTPGDSSGAECSTFQPSGPCVVETVSASAPPTPIGGAFVAGTYELVSKTLYSIPDGGTDAGSLTADPTATRETSIVTGSGGSFTFQNAITSGAAYARTNGTLTTDGTTQFTVAPTCPAHDGGGGSSQSYYSAVATASGQTISVFSPGRVGGTVVVNVYQKR